MLEKRKAKTCKRENRASRGKYFNAGVNKSAIRQMIAEAVTSPERFIAALRFAPVARRR